MKANVSYTEISAWLQQHHRIVLNFKTVDEKRVEVSYKPGSFIPTVRIIFKVEAVRKEVIGLSYECSLPVSLLISGAVGHLQSKIPTGIEVKPDAKQIFIILSKMEELKKAQEFVTLTDIQFTEGAVGVDVALL